MTSPRRVVTRALLALVAALALGPATPAPAAAPGVDLANPTDQWYPAPDGGTWTWSWSDSAYAPVPTKERYTVSSHAGATFELSWTTDGLDNGDGTVPSAGMMTFQRSLAGILNLGWSGTTAPPQFPILCPSVSQCANTVAGAGYQVIWGSRAPLLAEPLLKGAAWASTGGASNDVASTNRYLGTEKVTVPAFPAGVSAAKVQTDITQAGALGDPYGSGTRTTWWVRGVGPVKVLFQHTGGEVQRAQLLDTTLTPRAAPDDANYLPFVAGRKLTYRFRNSKHLTTASVQQVSVSQTSGTSARLDVQSVGKKGSIRLAGAYLLTRNLGGVTGLAGSTKSVTLAKFPAIGPASQPKSRRPRLLTPLDFLTYGFNPVLPGYPAVGQTWSSAKDSRDYKVYGVTGTTKIIGFQKVTVPAGTFARALVVRSQLKQAGFPYGSGTRTAFFVAGKGLVKLTFHHGDGSVSTIELA